MTIPRLLIAGTQSGVGKTTVTMGLLQGLRARGISVQPFKLGPDYIDPGYHTSVAGRFCRNLDSWLIPPRELGGVFERACAGADVALIEGMMGLYDGIGATGEEGSTAQLAKWLKCPVLLVLDAGALSRSAAAVVRGFVGFDRGVTIAGCFLNRVGGAGHYALVKEGIERLTGIPVVGYLPRDERCALPERHLGLVPSQEGRRWRRILGPLSARVREGVDLAAVLRLAQQAKPLGVGDRGHFFKAGSVSDTVPIGVAQDEAFHFYYPENMELLQELGGEIVPFSPLRDSHLPRAVAALYLGGGFPEIYAAPLSRNRGLHREIRQAVKAGMPTYAECGGFMYLTRSITTAKGRRYPMVGVMDPEVQMTDRLQHFGYREVRARRKGLLARAGERARGHEFHHSVLNKKPATSTAAYEATSATGGLPRLEGFSIGNLLASYIHLHFLSQPRWGKRFVEKARLWETVRRDS